jgi:hypothetical protein
MKSPFVILSTFVGASRDMITISVGGCMNFERIGLTIKHIRKHVVRELLGFTKRGSLLRSKPSYKISRLEGVTKYRLLI